jgi:CRISPR-associated protein Cmr6
MDKLSFHIPRDSRVAVTPGELPRNPGLALSKYIPWEKGSPVKKEQLARFLERVAAVSLPGAMLKAVGERQKQAVATLRDAGFRVSELEMETAGRMVIGLGSNTILETGLTLHPIYGFPYLPGSALKGLARAYFFADTTEPVKDVNRAKKQLAEFDQRLDVMQLFGGSNERDSRVGSVIFFDGLPVGKPVLEVDIQTPHYAKYYGGKNTFPTNTEAPVPISFLAVGAGARFRIHLAAREQEVGQLERAEQYLTKGLELLGLGGKTAAGYGRLKAVSFEDYVGRKSATRARKADAAPELEKESPYATRTYLDKDGNIKSIFFDSNGRLLPFEACKPHFKKIYGKLSEKKMRNKYKKMQKHLK